MRKVITTLFSILVMTGYLNSQPFKTYTPPSRGIAVQFYKNVEFLGFVFFLGSEYMGEQYEGAETLTTSGIKHKDWFAYNLALYKQYKSFKGNKNLEISTRFAENLQGSDLVLLLIQLKEFPHASLPDEMTPENYITFSEKKDSVEAKKNVVLFIEALNKFYQETDFDTYFRQNDHLYQQALQEIKSKLPSGNLLAAMEKFYRHRFDEYTLLPSLTIPSGMAFGARHKSKIFNAFGPFAVQQFTSGQPINMGFADEKHLRELSIHEFGHSFTNPVLDKIPAELITKTATLFDTIKTAMEDQGYNNWISCLYEHFVRAGEVIIANNLGNKKDAEGLQVHYIDSRKFVYLPIIIEELNRYDKNPGISYEETAIRIMKKLSLLTTNNEKPK